MRESKYVHVWSTWQCAYGAQERTLSFSARVRSGISYFSFAKIKYPEKSNPRWERLIWHILWVTLREVGMAWSRKLRNTACWLTHMLRYSFITQPGVTILEMVPPTVGPHMSINNEDSRPET